MSRYIIALLAIALVFPVAGCNKRFQRYTGAFGAAGAGAGAAYGSLHGGITAGEAAVIGGTTGGLAGAVVADMYDEKDWEGLDNEIARLRSENEQMRLAAAAKDNLIADRDAMLARAEAQAGELRGRLSEAEGQLADINGRLADAEGRLAAAQAEVDRFNRDRDELQSRLVANQSALEEKMREMEELQSRLGSDVEVGAAGEGITLTILNELLFPVGRADLSSEGEAVLSRTADIIREIYPDRNLVIEGHTDNQPIQRSQWRSNWELGSARALAVLHHMIDREAFSPGRLASVSYGETRPKASNATPEGQAINRRAVIVIMPATASSASALAAQPASAQAAAIVTTTPLP